MPQGIDFRKWYWFFGIGLKDKGSHQYMGDCPFCGKEKHFFVYYGPNKKIGKREKAAGMFNCRRCGKSGNHFTFMRMLYEANIKVTDHTPLAENRGIKPETFRHEGVFRDSVSGNWYIPGYNDKKTIVNLYKILDEGNLLGPGRKSKDAKLKVLSSPSPCTHILYRGHTITRNHKTIWLVEGHWDALVMLEVLAHIHKRNGKLIRQGVPDWKNELLKTIAVVGTPGSTTFKDEWCKKFKKKKVIICYDNDEAGLTGLATVKQSFDDNNVELSGLEEVQWRETDKANDIRDLLTETLQTTPQRSAKSSKDKNSRTNRPRRKSSATTTSGKTVKTSSSASRGRRRTTSRRSTK